MTLARISLVFGISGVLAAGTVWAVGHVRVANNEAEAIGVLRTINSAEQAYSSNCGHGRYSTTLKDLGTPLHRRKKGWLPDELADGPAMRNGYRFKLQGDRRGVPGPTGCHGSETQTTYYAVAVPVEPGETGRRAFATTETGLIWQMPGGAPPAEPFGPPADVVP